MRNNIRQNFESFLILQQSFNVYVFFLQVTFIHLFHGFDYAGYVLLLAVLFTLYTKVNYFWYVGIVIFPSLGYLNVVNLSFAVVSCHQKWKFLLLIYTLVDAIFLNEPELNSFYNMLTIPALLYQIYYKLPLQKKEENIAAFSFFSFVWLYFLIFYLIQIFGIDGGDQLIFKMIIITLSTVSSYFVMQTKMSQIFNRDIENLENASHFVHYIQETKRKLAHQLDAIGIWKMHISSCRDLNCFCKDPKEKFDFNRMYVRYLYKKGITKFKKTGYFEHLEYLYVLHLLDQNMLPLAIQESIRFHKKKETFWSYVMELKTKKRLRQELEKIEQNYANHLIDNPFEYEVNYELLKKQIMQLVELKIKYWVELRKPVTKILTLYNLGKQYLQKFNTMHKFYIRKINPVENELKIFSGSIIYNLFMLVATNYKELAETNMKNLKKINQSYSNKSQKSNYKTFLIKISIEQNSQGIIKNLSKSFSKLLGSTKPKSQYIGKNLRFMIPECYAKRHFKGLSELRRYHINNILGAEVDPIFILTESKNIVPTSVIVKYSSDIFNELAVIGFIKSLKNDNQYFLVDHDSRILYKTSDKFEDDIIYSSNIKNAILTFRDKWKTVNQVNLVYFAIEPTKMQLKFQNSNYTCTISSPLSTSFTYTQSCPPPIHISIHNQTQTYFVDNELIDQVDLLGCINKINVIIDQVETESQASNMSRRNEVVTIMKNFEESSSFGVFNQLLFVLILIGLIGLALTSIFFSVSNYSWYSSNNKSGNQLYLLETIYQIQSQMNRFIGKSLSLYGIANNFIKNSDFSSGYGVQDYVNTTYDQIFTICKNLSNLIQYNMIIEQSSSNNEYYAATTVIMNVTTDLSSQKFPFHSLLLISVQDCFEIQKGWSLHQRLIGTIYWKNIFDQFYQIIKVVKKNLLNEIADSRVQNILLAISFSVVLLLFLIPLEVFNRKLVKQDQYIFELMTSIDQDLIHKQILELVDLEAMLRNNSISTFSDEKNYDTLINNNFEDEAVQIEKDFDKASNYNNENVSTVSKRRRTDQLNRTGYQSPRNYFILNIFIFILLGLGIFFLHQSELNQILDTYNQQIMIRDYKNQRIALLTNIKKYIFRYNLNELIQNQTLTQWITNVIQNRRSNFQVNWIDSNLTLCNTSNPLCLNLTLNTEIGISMFEEILAQNSFYDLDVFKIAQEELQDQAMNVLQLDYEKGITVNLDTNISTMRNIQLGVYILICVVFVLLVLGNVLQVQKLKHQYIDLTKCITFLSEEMILKTKRIESFLHKMSKVE